MCLDNAAATKTCVDIPLIVDLDGTLVRSDLLIESIFSHLGQDPTRIFSLLAVLWQGKAPLKSHVAAATELDVSHLPYDSEVLALIREARGTGRPVYLASASNERYVAAIANYLGLFDGWFASTKTENLSAIAKANCLVATFGKGAFDYIGNDYADLAVWVVARRRFAVRASASVRSQLADLDPNAIFLTRSSNAVRSWTKLLRTHQWTKNALVLVPLLTAQRFDLLALSESLCAFLAFSLGASGIYIINDLVDLEADRKHPSKKGRALAAGTVSVRHAIVAASILLIASLMGALLISPRFGGVLVAYFALTIAYTFVLKRKMMVDVIALAALYTLRVIGGAAAISVPVSEWLLGFSMLIFTALALVKRYIELAARLDADLPDPSNRNYRKSDLDIVAALAAAASFNAVTVFALYISSETVHHLYRHPQALWLVCPILMYWLGRILMMAHRRFIEDDPIVFALRDWNSLVAAGLIGVVLISAI